MNDFGRRRDRENFPAAAPWRISLSIALAVLFSLSACASSRPALSPAAGEELVGGRASTLADCEAHGRLCAGLTVAVLDLEVAAGRVCFPADVGIEEVENVIASALRATASNEAAEVAAQAIRSAWPCAAAPKADGSFSASTSTQERRDLLAASYERLDRERG